MEFLPGLLEVPAPLSQHLLGEYLLVCLLLLTLPICFLSEWSLVVFLYVSWKRQMILKAKEFFFLGTSLFLLCLSLGAYFMKNFHIFIFSFALYALFSIFWPSTQVVEPLGILTYIYLAFVEDTQMSCFVLTSSFLVLACIYLSPFVIFGVSTWCPKELSKTCRSNRHSPDLLKVKVKRALWKVEQSGPRERETLKAPMSGNYCPICWAVSGLFPMWTWLKTIPHLRPLDTIWYLISLLSEFSPLVISEYLIGILPTSPPLVISEHGVCGRVFKGINTWWRESSW